MEEELMSAEEFTRKHPALMDAIGCTVRRELEVFRANGDNSANVQCSLDLEQFAFDESLMLGDAFDRIGKGDECLIRVPCSSENLRALRRVNGISFHILTSLLMAGGTILASFAIVGKLNKKQ